MKIGHMALLILAITLALSLEMVSVKMEYRVRW